MSWIAAAALMLLGALAVVAWAYKDLLTKHYDLEDLLLADLSPLLQPGEPVEFRMPNGSTQLLYVACITSDSAMGVHATLTDAAYWKRSA